MNEAAKQPRDPASHYRAVALICRQQAVLHPEASWSWLSEAERLEYLAAQGNFLDTIQRPLKAEAS
jgi:hypothetical protein